MTTRSSTAGESPNPLAKSLIRCGHTVGRYGLAVVLAWIGFGKYAKMESRVLVEHSPLMGRVYHVVSRGAVASHIGNHCGAYHYAAPGVPARLALAVVLFTGTLSFLFTTPGVVAGHAGGLPVLSALPGQFLLKDPVPIGVAVWTLGDSLAAARSARA